MLKSKDYKFAVVDGFDPDLEIDMPEVFEVYVTTEIEESVWMEDGQEVFAGPEDIGVHIPEVARVMLSIGITENDGMDCIFSGMRNGYTNQQIIDILNKAGWTNDQDIADMWRPDL